VKCFYLENRNHFRYESGSKKNHYYNNIACVCVCKILKDPGACNAVQCTYDFMFMVLVVSYGMPLLNFPIFTLFMQFDSLCHSRLFINVAFVK
jgi:hypothetical protein